MRRREFIALLGSALVTPYPARGDSLHAQSPTAKRLVGAWRFVSAVSLREDGTAFDRWGANSKGTLTFDRSGSFTQVIMAAESRIFGAKSFFAFGDYSVEEESQTIVTNIEGSSIARIIGGVQRRVITSLTEDELKYINLYNAAGQKVEAVWRRIRKVA
jgi:hypothetical protein